MKLQSLINAQHELTHPALLAPIADSAKHLPPATAHDDKEAMRRFGLIAMQGNTEARQPRELDDLVKPTKLPFHQNTFLYLLAQAQN